jgi:hypothetical protein
MDVEVTFMCLSFSVSDYEAVGGCIKFSGYVTTLYQLPRSVVSTLLKQTIMETVEIRENTQRQVT